MTQFKASLRPVSDPALSEPSVEPLVTPVMIAFAQAAGVAGAVGAVAWMTSHVTVDEVLHDAALFVHLASLILGFGAVLAVDWTALRWVLGHRPFQAVLTTAGHVHGAIWLGYAGLVASGLLLSPHVSSTWTVVKLVLVLLIGWNGLAAMALQRQLEKSEGGPGRRGLVIASCSAGISHACW